MHDNHVSVNSRPVLLGGRVTSHFGVGEHSLNRQPTRFP